MTQPAAVIEAPEDAPEAPPAYDQDLVAAEVLVEEVSIDGMCGVY